MTQTQTPTPMTPEEIEHELMRRDLWIKIAASVANNERYTSMEYPAQWADAVLKDFDSKFKVSFSHVHVLILILLHK